MKRIAIQLFGHLRTFEKTYPYFFQNVVLPQKKAGYEIDIYIHTWNELDHKTINYRNEAGESLAHREFSEEIIQKVKEIYSPKKILITPQQKCKEVIIIEKLGHFKRSNLGCLNMAYSLYQSSKIRQETQIKYDWVIVTRPDILFKKELSIDKLLGLYQEFHFDIPKNALFYAHNPFRNNFGVEESLQDQIWFILLLLMSWTVQLLCMKTLIKILMSITFIVWKFGGWISLNAKT